MKMNDLSRLKFFEISNQPFVFDRETSQVILLNEVETPQLVQNLRAFDKGNSFSYGEEALIDADELFDVINSGPASTLVNDLKHVKPSYSSLVLPIASQCNLKCPYCFAQTNHGGFSFPSYNEDAIDRLLDRLHELNGDTPTTLIFFGGEPLIKFNLIEYTVNCVKEKYPDMKIGYSITTNGTLINRKVADFFRENNVAVLLSMDGYDNEFNYRKFRNGKSSVDRVLKSIELLKSSNVYFEIRATLTSDNPYLYETHMFFEKLEVPYQIAFAYPSENTSHSSLSTFSEDSLVGLRKAYNRLIEHYVERSKKGLPFYDKLLPKIIGAIESRQKLIFSCSAGINYFTILANGDIHYCAHLMNNPEFVLGNLYDRKLKNSFISHPITPKAVDQIAECENCWIKNLCAGGCTSQKISEKLSPFGSYSRRKCALERLQYEYYLKLYVLSQSIGLTQP